MAGQLRLRAQKYDAREESSYAVDVLVDHGVPNLSNLFTYGVPSKMGNIQKFSLVSVPFKGRNCLGLVLGKSKVATENLKQITKSIFEKQLITEEQFDLVQLSLKRWGGFEWDYLKFFLPKGIGRNATRAEILEFVARKINQPELKIGSSYEDLLELIHKRVTPFSQTLIVVPNQKIFHYLKTKLNYEVVAFNSQLTQTERNSIYLEIMSGKPKVIIANRSGIFLPLAKGAEIILVDDQDFANYETRFPHWNARDLALLNSKNFSTTFYSHSPSLELLRLVQTGWMKMNTAPRKRTSFTFSNSKSSWQRIVKEGISKGPILVLTPDRGYVNSLVCINCRNIYRCPCGGKLVIREANGRRECFQCQSLVQNSACDECGETRLLSYRKGISKVVEEMGKQFPGTKIIQGESVSGLGKRAIVVSTYSQIPIYEYQAIIALNYERFAYQGNLRGAELARKIIFDLIALGPKDVYLEIPSDSYFSQTALKNDPVKAAVEELKEREELNLPPYSRVAKFDCDIKFSDTLRDQTFISEVQYSKGRAVIKFPLVDGEKFIIFCMSVLKIRSLKKLKPWKLEVDPLEI